MFHIQNISNLFLGILFEMILVGIMFPVLEFWITGPGTDTLKQCVYFLLLKKKKSGFCTESTACVQLPQFLVHMHPSLLCVTNIHTYIAKAWRKSSIDWIIHITAANWEKQSAQSADLPWKQRTGMLHRKLLQNNEWMEQGSPTHP